MNISALFNDSKAFGTRVTQMTGVSAKGPISARVIAPERPTTGAPMVAIHGISRNADELVEHFQSEAAARSRVIIVPEFDKNNWPVFQRITGKHRPDLALLALLNTLRQNGTIDDQPVDLFGFSGGAQLAHRFAMLFPELVNQIHLGAAGWYTLPVPTLPYPLGMGAGSSRGNWHLLMESSLPQFLKRPIHVYVGDEDTAQDRSLRREPLLNQVQGDTRVERAERYVSLISHCQAELGLPVTARLTLLEGCGHDFAQCCSAGGLVQIMSRVN
ncbi:alpha/beta fold hydrolase [Marinobacter confluentis]|uniref:Alpha/beta hydrolase n=1 Tax=Marinobacter confluentis TaxID=1697557 RepID=A0A4Z1BRT8_9GAMM|nr:hypothetical protein [Marinobacter confluentis]TGN40405.1 hypothetical protein E5Q11_09055 [Marinobacter confluentis]